jgi:hypothetical protein
LSGATQPKIPGTLDRTQNTFSCSVYAKSFQASIANLDGG